MKKRNKKFYPFLSHAEKHVFLVFFWILCLHENTFLYGEKSCLLTFLKLEKASEYHNQRVYIRGFLYQRENGDWILAKEPHLKTCCVGSKKKLSEQIAIYGDLTTEHLKHAVTVEGWFYAEPKWDHEGKLMDIFHLEKAKILPEQDKMRSVVSIALVAVAMGIFLVVFLSRLRNR